MAKGQKHSNREIRKKKADKPKPVAQASPFERKPAGLPKKGGGK